MFVKVDMHCKVYVCLIFDNSFQIDSKRRLQSRNRNFLPIKMTLRHYWGPISETLVYFIYGSKSVNIMQIGLFSSVNVGCPSSAKNLLTDAKLYDFHIYIYWNSHTILSWHIVCGVFLSVSKKKKQIHFYSIILNY